MNARYNESPVHLAPANGHAHAVKALKRGHGFLIAALEMRGHLVGGEMMAKTSREFGPKRTAALLALRLYRDSDVTKRGAKAEATELLDKNAYDAIVHSALKSASACVELCREIGRDDLASAFVEQVGDLSALRRENSAYDLLGELWEIVEQALIEVASLLRGFDDGSPTDATLSAFREDWPELIDRILAAPVGPRHRPLEGAREKFADDLCSLAARIRASETGGPRFNYNSRAWRLYRFDHGLRPVDREYMNWRWHPVTITEDEFRAADYGPLQRALCAAGAREALADANLVMPQLSVPKRLTDANLAIADYVERLAHVLKGVRP